MNALYRLTMASVFAGVALLSTGCASSGTNFNESHISEIKRGVTTEPQLITWFDEPENRSISSGGAFAQPMIVPGGGVAPAPAAAVSVPADQAMRTTLTWQYGEARVIGKSFIPVVGGILGGHESSHKSLSVILKEGVVENYWASTGGNETRGHTQSTPDR